MSTSVNGLGGLFKMYRKHCKAISTFVGHPDARHTSRLDANFCCVLYMMPNRK